MKHSLWHGTLKASRQLPWYYESKYGVEQSFCKHEPTFLGSGYRWRREWPRVGRWKTVKKGK